MLDLESSTIMSSVLKDSIFFLVGNIPASFRSANLRAYFSQQAEKNAFACFHYRHRPEHLKDRGKEQSECSQSHSNSSQHSSVTSKCCVVAVKSKFGADFLKTYHNKNWARHDGSLLVGKVRISKLDVLPDQPAESEEGNVVYLPGVNGTGSSLIHALCRFQQYLVHSLG